jgi:hypothetical protein
VADLAVLPGAGPRFFCVEVNTHSRLASLQRVQVPGMRALGSGLHRTFRARHESQALVVREIGVRMPSPGNGTISGW